MTFSDLLNRLGIEAGSLHARLSSPQEADSQQAPHVAEGQFRWSYQTPTLKVSASIGPDGCDVLSLVVLTMDFYRSDEGTAFEEGYVWAQSYPEEGKSPSMIFKHMTIVPYVESILGIMADIHDNRPINAFHPPSLQREAVTRMLARRYFYKIVNAPATTDEEEMAVQPQEFSFPHLQWMCRRILAEDDFPIDKSSRWLGFIQAGCIARGLCTTTTERDFSRPLFHEAYRNGGLGVPETHEGPGN